MFYILLRKEKPNIMSKNRAVMRLTKSIVSLVICLSIVVSNLMFDFGLGFGFSNAASDVGLSLRFEEELIQAGDIISVQIVASNMPNIITFGPIEVLFDSSICEFMSCKVSDELFSRFAVAAEVGVSGDVVNITGADEVSETAILENNMTNNAASSEVQEDFAEFVDPSYRSDSEVTICTLNFRVKLNVPEGSNVAFRLGNTVGFVDSNLDILNAYSDQTVLNVPVSEGLSNDATLANIRLAGTTLTPVFETGVFEYETIVGRDVTSVDVTAIPSNAGATVVISGNEDLVYGENIVTIDTMSHDGSTMHQYRVFVTRQETMAQESIVLVDAFGVNYSFVALPSSYTLPSGFRQTTYSFDNQEVLGFTREGVASVLLYLYDGVTSPAFYFYNPTTNTVMLYDYDNTVVRQSRILTVVNVPDNVAIPEGYEPTTITHQDLELNAFKNEDGDIIIYLKDELGDARFYAYDDEIDNFFEFRVEDKTVETFYKILFNVVLLVALLEGLMIVIIVLVLLKMQKDRINPRPRRV